MKSTRLWMVPALLLAAFALLAVACGGMQQRAQSLKAETDLDAIGRCYLLYCTDHNKGPDNFDDLRKDFPTDKDLAKVVASNYVIIWGINVNDAKQIKDDSTTVLGYEVNVPTAGGMVLLCDGTVEEKTAVAFNAMNKAAKRPQAELDLETIGLDYVNYCETNSRGPATLDDLIRDYPNDNEQWQKVKNGLYVLIFGVNFNDPKLFQEIGKSKTVLGYESATPTKGGAVLMCDGSTQHKTAVEFNALPKAKSSAKVK